MFGLVSLSLFSLVVVSICAIQSAKKTGFIMSCRERVFGSMLCIYVFIEKGQAGIYRHQKVDKTALTAITTTKQEEYNVESGSSRSGNVATQ